MQFSSGFSDCHVLSDRIFALLLCRPASVQTKLFLPHLPVLPNSSTPSYHASPLPSPPPTAFQPVLIAPYLTSNHIASKLSYYATRHASPCLLRAYTLMLNTFSHPILIILISSTVPYRNRNRTAATLLARSLFESYRTTDTDSSNTFSPSPQVIPPVHIRNTRPH